MSHWESASINISYDDFSKICRICLSKENLRTLQEVEYLIDLLRILTNTEVDEKDNMPQNICNNCIHKLEEISDFIDLIKFNDSCLRHVLVTKANLKTNTVTWANNSCNSNENTHDKYIKEISNNNTIDTQSETITLHSDTVSTSISQLSIEPILVKVEIPDDISIDSETSIHNRDNDEQEEYHGNNRFANLTEDERRRLRRRENNRKAAAKCRQKLRNHTINLVKEMTELETMNVSLKSQVKELEDEKDNLLRTLSKFKCTKKHLRILEEKIKEAVNT